MTEAKRGRPRKVDPMLLEVKTLVLQLHDRMTALESSLENRRSANPEILRDAYQSVIDRWPGLK